MFFKKLFNTYLSNNYGNTSLTLMVTTDNGTYNNAGQVTQGNDKRHTSKGIG